MGRVKIVRASAGSGKTYRLAYEYVRRALVDPEAYRHILAVTFTNKATDEMKRRIIREINDLSNGKTASGVIPAFAAELQRELNLSAEALKTRAGRLRTRILHDYSHFTILTIDKFFQRILRAFVRELGMENDFTLELQSDPVLAQAADRLIEETLTEATLREWIGRYLEEQIDEGGRWDVARALTTLGGEILHEDYRPAEAPSPEGRQRLQAIVADASSQVSAIENRMAAIAREAIQIIEDEDLAIGDFHYGKAGFVNYFYKTASGDAWGGYGKRVADALMPDARWAAKDSPRGADIQSLTPRLQPLLADLCALYDKYGSFARTTALLRENFRVCALLGDLSEHLRAVCEERNVMLLPETQRIIRRLIDGNDTPFIFEKAGNHFSNFLIDEFQDTSRVQWENFRPLLANAVAQSADAPVLLVGDVKQSIYRWRGGDWRILGRDAAHAFAGAEELTLGTNYRSGTDIVRFNNEMITAVVRTADDELNAALDASETLSAAQRDPLRGLLSQAYADARQMPRPGSEEGGYVRWTQFDPGQEGARENILIETVEDLQRRGFQAGDIAILVRTHAEAAAVADCLLDRKSACPDSPFVYDFVTQEALTLGRAPVVRFVIACLRLSLDPQDSIARAFFQKTLGRPLAEELSERDRAILGGLKNGSLEEAFEEILLAYHPDSQPGNTAWLQAFHDRLLAFGTSRIADIPLFLAWWDETGARESIHLPGGQNALSILTIHKAKGLEFPAVILPYASWEMDPSSRTLLWAQAAQAPFDALQRMPVRYKKAMAGSAFAADYYREKVFSWIDNVNLLYVAVTRAGEELHLISPQVKEPKGSRVHELLLRAIGGERSEWGTPVHRSATTENALVWLQEGYPAFRFAGKLRIRREDEASESRRYGRLMHRLFESVATESEIAPTLARFEAEGTLSADDRALVTERIAEAMSNPLIHSWFDGSWNVVRNEADLIVPAGSTLIRRPDRVMIGPDRVVVVDYKFGEQVSPAHARQVGEYLDIVRRMGHGSAEGYVWYVLLNQVVAVTSY